MRIILSLGLCCTLLSLSPSSLSLSLFFPISLSLFLPSYVCHHPFDEQQSAGENAKQDEGKKECEMEHGGERERERERELEIVKMCQAMYARKHHLFILEKQERMQPPKRSPSPFLYMSSSCVFTLRLL
jgi:hypothetical protein